MILVVEFVGVRTLTRRSQGGGAGGVITMAGFQVVSRFRVGGEGDGVEPGGGDVPALELAQFPKANAFAVVRPPWLSLRERRRTWPPTAPAVRRLLPIRPTGSASLALAA